MVSVYAALLDGLGLNFLSSFEDGFGPAEIDVGGCEVAEAFVVAVVIVVVDEGRHGVFDRNRPVEAAVKCSSFALCLDWTTVFSRQSAALASHSPGLA